ncbi:MAG TPA: hypothetical protein DDY37_00475, partial [Legionella sp.]|nr:hypothetical protein [Legionella sp.]
AITATAHDPTRSILSSSGHGAVVGTARLFQTRCGPSAVNAGWIKTADFWVMCAGRIVMNADLWFNKPHLNSVI